MKYFEYLVSKQEVQIFSWKIEWKHIIFLIIF